MKITVKDESDLADERFEADRLKRLFDGIVHKDHKVTITHYINDGAWHQTLPATVEDIENAIRGERAFDPSDPKCWDSDW